MATVILEYHVDFWAIGALPLGVGLEWLFGGLARKPGPGRPVERLVELAEGGLRVAVARWGGGSRIEQVAGVVLVVVVVGLVGGLTWLAVEVFNQLGGWPTLLGRSLLIAWGLSFRRFGDQVFRASEASDLMTARRAAASILGLESNRLDQSGIRRSCVEILGDRAHRLIMAPLFWMAVAGPAGLWSYQAIGTIRAMVDNERGRHRDFGTFAARLDGLANFLPSRLTWLLVALSAALLGEDGGAAFRCGRSEGRRFPGWLGVWGRASLVAAVGLSPDCRSVTDSAEPKTVRRASRIIQVAGLHALVLVIAYRVIVMAG